VTEFSEFPDCYEADPTKAAMSLIGGVDAVKVAFKVRKKVYTFIARFPRDDEKEEARIEHGIVLEPEGAGIIVKSWRPEPSTLVQKRAWLFARRVLYRTEQVEKMLKVPPLSDDERALQKEQFRRCKVLLDIYQLSKGMRVDCLKLTREEMQGNIDALRLLVGEL